LREQTEARKAAEAERDALKARLESTETKSQQEIAALKSQFETVLATLRAGQQPPKAEPKAEAPDLGNLVFENPTSFVDHLSKTFDAKLAPIVQRLDNDRVTFSLQLANVRHGDTFKAAVAEIAKLDQANPNNQRLVADLYNSSDPGEAVVAWHKRNVTFKEVGDDPNAFKEKIAKETRESLAKDPEFRKQLLAELRAEAEDDGTGRPNTTLRLPRSLLRNGGTSRESFDADIGDGSQQAIADSAWADR
jgi:hypothetical protein